MQFGLRNCGLVDHLVGLLHRVVEFADGVAFGPCHSTDSQVRRDFASLMTTHAVSDDKETPVRVHCVLVVCPNATLIGRASPSESQTTLR